MMHAACIKAILLFTFFLSHVYSEMDEEELRKKHLEEEAAYNSYKGYIPEIEIPFAIQMGEEFGLRWCGTHQQTHGKVEFLGMKFVADRRASIPEARALFLVVMDKFVEAINAHEHIQPFLEVQPFNYEHIEITINFGGARDQHYDGSVTWMFNAYDDYNKIIYFSSDAYKADSIDILEESHEEAVRLAEAFPIKELGVHESLEWEEPVDRTLAEIREEMDNKYALGYWTLGGDMQEGIKDIRANMKIYRPANVVQARQIFVEITERIVTVVNEKLKPYLKEYPLTPERVKLYMEFINRNRHPHPDSLLMDVRLDNGEISYYREFIYNKDNQSEYVDTGRIIEAKENYQDAKAIVEKNPQNLRHFRPSFISDLVYALQMWGLFFYAVINYFFWNIFP